MQYQSFGTTGWNVSRIGFGAWAIGAEWGHVSEDDAMAALHAAFERGVNFIDTADVYGDGRSERLAGRLRRERPRDDVYIATKSGRRLDPHVADGYNRENLTAFVDRSLTNLDTETIDLVQLHCPPTEVYYRPEVFGVMDDLVAAGKIRHYGVSVEKVEEALGVPFDIGLAAVERLRELVPTGATMAMFALQWLLMFEAVTLAIPGAKNPEQAVDNATAADLPSLDDETMSAVYSVYDELIKPHVHQRW